MALSRWHGLQASRPSLHHFWPEFNLWLGEVPDTRFQPMVTCHRRFLLCWGLLLFLRKPASLGVLPLFPTPRGSLFDRTLPNPPPGLLLNCSRSSVPGFLPPNICFTDLHKGGAPLPSDHGEQALDRKSTRLNSSHLGIS